MKLRIQALSAAFWLTLVLSAFGQGTFQNLDFESPVFVPVGGSPFLVEAAPALPGWATYIGTNQVSEVLHNTSTLSLAAIAIWGPNNPSPDYLQGQYYVKLQNSFPISLSDIPSIRQTGTIPPTAQSIQFYTLLSVPTITAVFSEQWIPLSLLGIGSGGQRIWAGDVTSFAGQTGELSFSGEGYLDYIQFSNQPIPEPSTVGLLALGALLLGWRFIRWK